MSDAFIDGVVVDVEPGSGWFWTFRGKKEITHEVRRGHPRAVLTTALLVVRPCSWIDGSAAGLPAPDAAPAGPGDTVRISIGGDPGTPLRRVRDAYEGERIAALLDTTPTLEDQPGVFDASFDGELLGLVDDEGVIAFRYSGAGYFYRKDLRGISVDDLLSVPPQRRPDTRLRG